MSNLLCSLGLEKITYYISLIAIIGLVLAAIIVSLNKKKSFNSKAVVYAAVSIAMSFVLSFIKIYELPYGGSITLASFVPLIIYAYSFGFIKGLIAGLLYGLLQFIQGPYFINVFQFILDYLLAFMSISVAGIFGTLIKNRKISLITGTIAVGITRLINHVLAGIIFYSAVGSRAEILPSIISDINALPAFVYSLTYNSLFIIPDIIICILVVFFLLKNEAFNNLLNSLIFNEKKIKNNNIDKNDNIKSAI
jgi:thiamine transporter